ncbi:unnamed protein product [Sphenostylis stenocarpa]|uniref:Uncharacterized protein n=1 Tax=Sphenostylis stenocarpa TaxID=92480 RepID=A0AA86VXY8_9FABA|nr:unnamed protein product [Sphenostylis stenocarpa]
MDFNAKINTARAVPFAVLVPIRFNLALSACGAIVLPKFYSLLQALYTDSAADRFGVHHIYVCLFSLSGPNENCSALADGCDPIWS